ADQAALARLNRVLHPGRIYIGQSLILPQAESSSESETVGIRPHPVQPGEGVLQFAAAQSLNPWQLALSADGGTRLWWSPGEWVMVPTGNQESIALPAPITELAVSPRQAAQGGTVVVRAGISEPTELRGQLADWQLSFMEAQESERIALQGVHAMIDPGLYELSIDWGDPEIPGSGFSQLYPVRTGNYSFDPILYVPEETVGPENTIPEDELFAEMIAPVTPEKHWQGPFGWPSDHFVENFPSVFGTRRNYNNTGYNAYHTGLDFYGGIGVGILAPAPGEVVFSDDLVVRGKTTIIDHGWGVYSVYMHQSESMVAAGDQVETGQVIGLVGASGRVTGAHLHWEIRVGGVPVQPLDWIEQGYP
ncbi:MAG: M23 family metallopeptidase, partial [Anaerolineales bacterium]